MQPDETAFPETQDTLGMLASAALPADARARHLHAIRMRAAELGPAPAPAGLRPPLKEGLAGVRWRGRRAAAIVGVWMGSLSLGTGVAAASAMNDLPGQPLYGLKRAVENVQLRLPGDVEDDVRRRLDLAARRLAEAEALHANGADAALLAGALGDAQTLIDEAGELADGDATLTSAVAGSASQARVRLTELLNGGLPDQAADRAREAIEAATERAEQREQEREDRGDGEGRGRGRGGDRSEAPSTVAPGETEDGGQGRGRGRGGDEDEDADSSDAGDSDSGGSGRGGAPPSEDDDDDDASPSGRGRSSDGSGPDDDDDDENSPGESQGSSHGQGGSASGQGGSGQGGSGQGNSGQGGSRQQQDD